MRWITLDGAVNVRDIGGLPTVDGSVTASKRLLRADNLQGLSEADVSHLINDLGLTQIVDLRTDLEVTSEGPGPMIAIGSVPHVNLSLIPASARLGAGRKETLDKALLTEPDRTQSTEPEDAVVASHYLSYLVDRPDSVTAALRAIADTPGAALVHCAAGKDRTGVIVAIALSAVGVRREAVAADYAATADRIESIMARLRSSPTYAKGLDRLTLAQHTPRAANMERFLDQVDAEFGGPLAWLAGQGFGPDDVAKLRAKLVAP